MDIKQSIASGNTSLGIELGSTRIKAVLINDKNITIASGSHDWENRFEDGIWTYHLSDIIEGVRECYSELAEEVRKKYNIPLTTIGSIGVSAMMHGYMVFNEADELLVSFRTWRNTMTEQASKELTKLFDFNIPQRWSIAHLYQAILNKEEHVSDIRFQTTLAGYLHWRLTGERVVGIGEASGMMPIDSKTNDFDENMILKFEKSTEEKGYPIKLRDIFPKVLTAGEEAGVLTKEGADFLDVSGRLKAGIPLCPPEGDAGTGMTATNSIAVRTGNVSAGTSVFAMIVMEKKLSALYEQIDMVTTPDGSPVAMVHCNNCTSDFNAWGSLLHEFAKCIGVDMKKGAVYDLLFEKALEGEKDGGGLLAYNYHSGEHITGFTEGRPLFVRMPDHKLNLANFARTHLFTSLGALKTGMDILLKKEGVKVDSILGHGGFFKAKEAGMKIMAAAMNAPVSVMETAGEGGAWGIALLASFMKNRSEEESLEAYLETNVFSSQKQETVEPDQEDVSGFEEFMKRYTKGLEIERKAVEVMK